MSYELNVTISITSQVECEMKSANSARTASRKETIQAVAGPSLRKILGEDDMNDDEPKLLEFPCDRSTPTQ
jgi:hypothetical protein